MVKKLLILFLLLLFLALEGIAQKESIRNGILWNDTDGNGIQAHGGDILQYNDRYYWIGTDRSQNFDFQGINLYVSNDLMNWKFLNKIVDKNTNEQMGNSDLPRDQQRFTERPNLVYNELTGKFVIWAKYQNPGYTAGEVAIFTSSTIDGDYDFIKAFQPAGYDANDCSFFTDDDGSVYFIANHKGVNTPDDPSDNGTLNLYKLTEDYMDVEGEPAFLFPGQSKEAPAIFKEGDTYYMLSSNKTGWDPNQGTYTTSKSLTSGWAPWQSIGNRITYDTQPTDVVTIRDASGKPSYYYFGDRYKDPELPESKYILLPLQLNDGVVSLDYIREFTIDMQNGSWKAFDNNTYVPQDNWSLVNVSTEQNETGQLSAKASFDGDLNSFWHSQFSPSVIPHPHEIIVDMGDTYDVSGFLYVPRPGSNQNGVIRDFQLFLSKDGENWGAPVAAGWMGYNTEIFFPRVSASHMKILSRTSINGQRVSSAAEFKLLTNDNYEPGRTIYPYYNADQEGWNTGDKILVERGGRVQFGPQAEFKDGQTKFFGSYSYHGPDEFYANTRGALVENIQEENLGKYTIFYLDERFSVQKRVLEVAFKMETISIEKTDVACNGDATGTATIEVEGGFPPYTYEWSDGQVTQEATDLIAGTYEVIVTDSEGNSITESIIIKEPEAITFELTSDQLILKGYGEECVDLQVKGTNGGTGTYTYTWSNGETSDLINVCPNETTVYSVEVTDSEGCVITKQVTVEVINVDCTTGNGMDKVEICWQGKSKCVSASALPALLKKGATIGSCDSNDLVIKEAIVSPSPTRGISQLRMNSKVAANAKLVIYNLSGTSVATKDISIQEGLNYFDLDLSEQIPGVYIIQINGDNFQSETVKIFKE